MKILNKLFHLDERNANVKNEVLGGLITFIAMCYILPVNAGILSDMGMDKAGVFAITAIVSFIVTAIMGLVANYPIALSAGMGLNAYLAYTIASQQGYTWQQCMILLTVAGLIFFAFSLTPVRKIIIESIPKDLRCTISACLGGFILFVGLRGSGIIVASSTLVGLGSFADPGMLLAFVAVILALVLTFSKRKTVSSLAIPIAIFSAAIIGVVISSLMINGGFIVYVPETKTYAYATGVEIIDNCSVNLPIAPWISNPSWGISGVDKVFLYGLFDKTGGYDANAFTSDLGKVFTNPTTYVAIFSLMFVNLFDTTATLYTFYRRWHQVYRWRTH